ncbi:MAG TPA: threonine synthase [Clostridia bacterium]|nr:threonine synthase [Clostridia bacterium]
MLYVSTRGGCSSVTAAEAIKLGIAPDGGLFVPETEANIPIKRIEQMADLNYVSRAVNVLRPYLTDYSEQELYDCASTAYNQQKFADPDIAPLHMLEPDLHVLELWHGPTCAFKDMALQIMPHLLTRALTKTGENSEIVILVATSGDTGKAALEGFKDVAGTRIIVFYPEKGISEMQRLQMVTQEGNNVDVIAVKGNFDDAQNGVKKIFADTELKENLYDSDYKFSSANSINWGRLVPQIVYYFSSYAELIKRERITIGEKINFVVPTGNFGDILAGFYASKMGLPIHKLVCASNANNVLTDFIHTGIYDRRRDFKKTISPSMDILISSNLERLLYEITDHDSGRVKGWMEGLVESGFYEVDDNTKKAIQEIFWPAYASDDETIQTIAETYRTYSYTVDTHTAVGVNAYGKYKNITGDNTPTVIISTASPFKFNTSVAKALLGNEAVSGKDEFRLLKMLRDKSNLPIPKGLRDLDKKTILHETVSDKNKMKDAVLKILE